MPTLFNDIDPADLTGFVRASAADRAVNEFRLGQVLPDEPVDDIEYRFYSGGAGLVEAAQYRAYDSESQIGTRPPVMRVSGELPPVSRKIRLGEYDRLRLRNASPELLQSAVLKDAVAMEQAVSARLELARSEALYTGQLVLNENGVVATVNYGRTGTHNATAAAVWSNTANATPITDLINCRDLIAADAGGAPDVIFMNSSVYSEMIATAQVQNLATVGGVTPSLVSDAAVSTILEAHGLPQIVKYDARVRTAGGVVRVLANDRVIMADSNQLGATVAGITAEQLEFASDGAAMGGGIFAVATKEFDPVSVWTKAAAIALPVLANPDLSVGLAV